MENSIEGEFQITGWDESSYIENDDGSTIGGSEVSPVMKQTTSNTKLVCNNYDQ